MKIIKSNTYMKADDARYCLFVRTRWETGSKDSRRLQEYFIDTVCNDPAKYPFDVKRHKVEIIDFERTKHGKRMCENCVRIYKARRALLKR